MKKKIFSILFALVLVLSFSLVAAVPVAAQVSEVWVDDDFTEATPGWNDTHFDTIQEGVDVVSLDGTVNVAAGLYDEQVAIVQGLTLQGVGNATLIKPSGPELLPTTSIPWIGGGTGTMSAIVEVVTDGDEVTIRDLKIDASSLTSKATTWQAGLVYLETGGKVEGVTVFGNGALPDRTAGIFAAALTHSASLEVTGCTAIGYNRAGIYALGATFVADYHHNEINGPGPLGTGVPNGMFFLDGATGSATYNVVTDLAYTGEEYLSTGLGTFNAGADIVFAYNDVSNVDNAFALSNNTSGTVIEYNEVYGCYTGVRMESGATASVIQYNDIHDNVYAIRCDEAMGVGNVAHSNNFVNNAGPYDRPGYDYAVTNLYSAEFDASNNWWGDASGPSGVGVGSGDSVSANVDYDPWFESLVVFTTESSTEMTATYTATPPPVIGISVTPTTTDFGAVVPGVASVASPVTVTNIGDVAVDLTAEINPESHPPVYADGLTIDGSTVEAWTGSAAVNAGTGELPLVLTVPGGTAPGTYTATLIFWAEMAE